MQAAGALSSTEFLPAIPQPSVYVADVNETIRQAT